MSIDNIAELTFKSKKWHAERRRCEQFLNAAHIRFRTMVAAGEFEAADRAYTDLLQVMDDMMQLAGCQK